MAFTPQTINKELDMANLAKHNTNYAGIKTELDSQASAVSAHTGADTAHGSTPDASAGKIVQRDTNGRAKVAAPSAPEDIARKAEVDAVQSALDSHAADADIHLSEADREKLGEIEPNQNAFSTINGITATSETDSITFKGGTGITVTQSPGTKEVSITATGDATPGPHALSHVDGADQVPDAITSGASGLMSGSDAKFVREDGETKTGAQAKADAAQEAAELTAQSLVTDLQDDLTTHTATQVHNGEAHGLRVTDGELEWFDGTDWVAVKSDQGQEEITTSTRFYVSSDTGSDSNDGLTPETAWKTLQYAADTMSKYKLKYAAIYITLSGTFDEDVTLIPASGVGSINIERRTGVGAIAVCKSISIRGIGVTVNINNISFTINRTTGASDVVYVGNQSNVEINSCQLTASGFTYGIRFSKSTGRVSNCTISNKSNFAITAQATSTITSEANAGSGNGVALVAEGASTIGKSGSQPTGTVAEQVGNGGVIRT